MGIWGRRDWDGKVLGTRGGGGGGGRGLSSTGGGRRKERETGGSGRCSSSLSTSSHDFASLWRCSLREIRFRAIAIRSVNAEELGVARGSKERGSLARTSLLVSSPSSVNLNPSFPRSIPTTAPLHPHPSAPWLTSSPSSSSPQHKTIESVLERGEKLDNLVERSNALSAQSKMFYKTAKKVRFVPSLHSLPSSPFSHPNLPPFLVADLRRVAFPAKLLLRPGLDSAFSLSLLALSLSSSYT